ncbi:HAD hydrolase family protein [Streptacidiphilus sp. PB12-B1b]|uniref:HAD family hydrolase n=1 Tax=Streptacidiphilus sp. PB12-B1b TaxID=2705012 RepID=UPI0015F993ED|nr:HAD hydrolase family protein [Streptacidiphilus sp. PB12-B1b]QMU79913.1 HAD hydrolase family protein [Streptacidiphilus sp. PB12-B1b]
MPAHRPSDRVFDLVATDLDGTLLRSDHTVSERTRRALAAATAAGAVHIVVTGRSASWTRPTLDAIGYTGLAVCGQGAQLYDAGAHRELTSVTLDRQLARTALAKIEAETGPLGVAVGQDGLDGVILVGPGYRMPGDEPMAAADPADFWAKPITRMFLQHPALGDDELARTAREIAGQLVDVVVSGPGFVEVLPLGLSKATGLALAAARLGITKDRAIAFGDMPNDLPMFRWAACGVAMANAHPALLTAADEVTLSNDADGVAAVLERLYPQP